MKTYRKGDVVVVLDGTKYWHGLGIGFVCEVEDCWCGLVDVRGAHHKNNIIISHAVLPEQIELLQRG